MYENEIDKMDKAKLHRTLQLLFKMFVAGDYDGISRIDHGNRLTSVMLRDAIQDWPSPLAMPPEEELIGLADAVEIDNSHPRAWSVDVSFWTIEEGRSDLSLRLTLLDSEHDTYTIEVDDIEVL